MNPEVKPRMTPKDFFLWVGAMVTLYGSVVAFIALLFQYIDYAYPDNLQAYIDPYSGAIRISMASLIVLFPIFLLLMRLIRRSVVVDPTRVDIWIRRWALYLTLFIAGVTLAIDLITLINTFLGGDLTTRFVLKVVVVFLVIGAGFLHFLSDLWGYWNRYPSRARSVGYAAVIAIIAAIVGGFLIIGSPSSQRYMRFDAQKVSDLQSIQWQIVSYWQQKQKLPGKLSDLEDPIQGFIVPKDPQGSVQYAYTSTGPLSFTLCALFNRANATGQGVSTEPARSPSVGIDENWAHTAGKVCFERTIDPERYPPFQKTKAF